ncbi:unnamed protein product [Spirodela intermedia]|uniref:Uncharacterized protein n=1 Tax=Spirodela intermedia TaxID=51605 RepID=A0A7I8JRT6_SPIIN|nr:unnamed protein product [Spirodela intermedia]CAA6672132.1 unnamed protein product [Spirodela intermedia]
MRRIRTKTWPLEKASICVKRSRSPVPTLPGFGPSFISSKKPTKELATKNIRRSKNGSAEAAAHWYLRTTAFKNGLALQDN